MVQPQRNLSAQNIFRLIIQKELRPDPGTETVEVWGEIEVTSPANVNAVDLRLKKIENLLLTVDTAEETPDIFASKQVFNKERKNNNASIFLWDNSTDAQATGSHYVNFLAMGE